MNFQSSGGGAGSDSPTPSGGTTRSFGNMLNSKPTKRKPFSAWEKIGK